MIAIICSKEVTLSQT